MRTYKEDIESLKEKYEDHDKSYDEHIDDMRRLNRKLASISQGQYTDYMMWVKSREEPDVEFRLRRRADDAETAAMAS